MRSGEMFSPPYFDRDWVLPATPLKSNAPLTTLYWRMSARVSRISSSPAATHTDTGQIFRPPSPDHHHAVLLQIVSFPRNVRDSALSRR